MSGAVLEPRSGLFEAVLPAERCEILLIGLAVVTLEVSF